MSLALLAACGRIDFDDRVGAGDDVSTDGIGRCGVGASAPDSVTLAGLVVDYTDFTGDYTAFAGAALAFTNAGSALGSTTSDGSGAYSVTFATGGQAQRVEITLASPGYFTSTTYADLLVDRSQSGALLQIIGGGAMSSIYGDANVKQDENAGTLVLDATDCDGQPVAGVTYVITPAPGRFEYNNASGLPDPSVTATELPNGNAIAYNMPRTDTARIEVSRAGVPQFAVDDVLVLVGSTMTTVHVHLP